MVPLAIVVFHRQGGLISPGAHTYQNFEWKESGIGYEGVDNLGFRNLLPSILLRSVGGTCCNLENSEEKRRNLAFFHFPCVFSTYELEEHLKRQ
jgi:hypothetical protein